MGTTVFAGSNTAAPLNDAMLAMQTVTDAIVATPGGTQATAIALTSAINRIGTCATAADSVKLPLAVAGLEVFVANRGAASCQVFGSGTDTINGVATATGVALATTKSGRYYCTKSAPAGNWELHLGA